MRLLLKILGLFIGVFAMVFGEFDDSPGLQGLGMLLILYILYTFYKNRRVISK
jgi:hypothetical protein